MREYVPNGLVVSGQDYDYDNCPVVTYNNIIRFSNAAAYRFSSRELYYLSTETGRCLQFHVPVLVEMKNGRVYVDMLKQETAGSLQSRLWALMEVCPRDSVALLRVVKAEMPKIPQELFSSFQRMIISYVENRIDKSILYASLCELARNAIAYDELTAFLAIERLEAQFGYERVSSNAEHGRSESFIRGAHGLNMGHRSEELQSQRKIATGV